MKRRLLLVALCAVLAMFTGACSSPDSPKTKPTASAPPSQTQAPKLPALARENSEAGAEAAFRHFLEATNFAAITGNFEPFDQIANTECEGCATIRNHLSDVYDAGGHVEGNAWVLQSIDGDLEPDGAYVAAQVTTEAGMLTAKAGAKPEKIPSRTSNQSLYARLAFASGSWSITELGTETS